MKIVNIGQVIEKELVYSIETLLKGVRWELINRKNVNETVYKGLLMTRVRRVRKTETTQQENGTSQKTAETWYDVNLNIQRKDKVKE